jgi:competence protein ComEC
MVHPACFAGIATPATVNKIGCDNANSITLAVEYADRRLLLPGDLETPGLDDLMAEEPYDCDILLAPHHGSRRSDPPGFAAWSKPEWVVISGGGGDDAKPAMQTYERAGANVFSTNDVGTVGFHIAAGTDLQIGTRYARSALSRAGGLEAINH